MTGNLQILPIELTDNRRSYENKSAVSERLHLFPTILQSVRELDDIVLFITAFSTFQILIGF
ncbi:hypothetical protein MYP_4384 [Sporocytophaga myxococcoides]|uniref:Uncharacterized protein n=1 Tax=Sporocytophaga myxococcoides TaxID=153721 RepID=A0A098LKW7_9BACT|nr:hypothetical protein [Sporocytophaga myxococcoides]GAL87154.1 hypothetical protein MYP_4384 [Sporocytophaga myxococcoides]